MCIRRTCRAVFEHVSDKGLRVVERGSLLCSRGEDEGPLKAEDAAVGSKRPVGGERLVISKPPFALPIPVTEWK